jgi:hypothetical protein
MSQKYYSVYTIRNPETLEPVYVGMTTDVGARFTAHTCKSEGPMGEEKLAWINSLISIGKKPLFIIEYWTISKYQARVEECRLISEYKLKGLKLFNTIIEIDHTPFDRKPVKDQNGIVYRSVLEASKKTGCQRQMIRRVINGHKKSINKFIFSWA